MAKFEIIVGSVLGASEYVAEALQTELLAQNHCANLHLAPELADIDNNSIWLFCSSTHGAGDFPDNIQPFIKQFTAQQDSPKHFTVVGLGDSSYDTYCFAAEKIEELLVNAGSELIQTSLHIDVLNHPIPEDVAVEWLKSWISKF
ncbi:FMN-binding protein MioC [Paraglaciecola sp. L3A3]|uniref:FMN-binding protein MioC n=1 Tax=Paraglaciecola sp. L3A3 TaxID=2686358 RepID=UPI00131CDCE3|nr:FMN-binding protein MioC [Paraglaciecola sp. L3A3]